MENKKVNTMRLYLDLKDENLTKDDAVFLKRYGESKTGYSLTRDIIVPDDIMLHNLHYVIQRLYGWNNYHMRRFALPEEIFENITDNKVKNWSKFVGILFQAPSQGNQDIFWDEDYKRGSYSNWLRKKYTGPYNFNGVLDDYDEAQKDVAKLLEKFSDMEYRDPDTFFKNIFEETGDRGYKKVTSSNGIEYIKFNRNNKNNTSKSKRCNIIDLTVDEMKFNIMTGSNPEDLMESLKVSQILSSDRKSLKTDGKFPVTNELIYNYDFGDGWEVYITRKDNYDDLIESNSITEKELNSAEKLVTKTHRPICINREGISVMDDVGGLIGFCDFLGRLYEGKKSEREELYEWAEYMQWYDEKTSIKEIL